MTDILIIGGGLSGLAVAQALEQKGLDWSLFEARSRFGGRMLSATADDGSKYDLGPAWIWPHQRRIRRLVDSLGLSLEEQYSTGNCVFEDQLGRVRRDLDMSIMAGTLRLPAGLAAVAEKLGASLPQEKLHLGHKVKALSRSSDTFIATVTDGHGRDIQSSARRLVFALPPRLAAASVDLSGLVPDATIRAMAEIPTWMAGHGKVVAVYDHAFWREQGLSGDAISHAGPLMEVHDLGFANRTRPGALFGFVNLSMVNQRPDLDQLAALVKDQLSKLFGLEARAPKHLFTKLWLTDALTATEADAFSHDHPRGGVPAELGALAAQGIIFAGAEVSAEEPGLVEGALEAAEAAVRMLTTQ